MSHKEMQAIEEVFEPKEERDEYDSRLDEINPFINEPKLSPLEIVRRLHQ